MTRFSGLTARHLETSRLTVNVLERDTDDAATPADRTIVLIHGSVASSLLWAEIMQDLPSDVRVIALDLRGFGETENAPVDATRGVRDFSDDLAATLDALDIPTAHLVGWGLGGAVVLQYALDHPVLSLTLQSPVSPYGFGGTRLDGTRLTDDDAGTGAGAANPDFVQRLTDADTTADAATSPRDVFRTTYVAPGYTSEHEDAWIDAMLSTSTASGNYPGDAVSSENWPGFAPGSTGVLNALAPRYFDVSAIVDLDVKPPVLWVRGDADAIISDTSFSDSAHLGAVGVLPDWPGSEVAPAQPMVSQTRAVLDAYAAGGGEVTELVLEGVGYSAHLERPALFRQALLSRIGYVGIPVDPAPPTETIILRSAD
jgi:pimeloyl-ACP methyl ester carboxylesterase